MSNKKKALIQPPAIGIFLSLFPHAILRPRDADSLHVLRGEDGARDVAIPETNRSRHADLP
jgi:hypothetical protein